MDALDMLSRLLIYVLQSPHLHFLSQPFIEYIHYAKYCNLFVSILKIEGGAGFQTSEIQLLHDWIQITLLLSGRELTNGIRIQIFY